MLKPLAPTGDKAPASRRARFKPPSLKRLAVLLLFIVPLAAWVIVKPVRVLAPQLMQLSCPTATVCVDDPAQLQTASALYAEALAFVSAHVSPIQGQPTVIFCSTQACADSFGLGARSAVTLGTFGTVIGPRAWKPYYVRHELIHFLQAERLGVLPLLFKPSWFVEGMAYSLSEDPRPLLAEPWEGHRQRFKAWFGGMEKTGVWAAAKKL